MTNETNQDGALDAVLTAADVKPLKKEPHEALQAEMARLLADTFRLILKTQNFHWNVEGPQFSALHALFEEQYGELREALDEIAERMRALGVYAPGSFAEYDEVSTVKDSSTRPDAGEMCRELAEDHRRVSVSAARVATAAAQIGDEGTADLAIGRTRVSDKAAWILDAHTS